jgi:hypothetical protein
MCLASLIPITSSAIHLYTVSKSGTEIKNKEINIHKIEKEGENEFFLIYLKTKIKNAKPISEEINRILKVITLL